MKKGKYILILFLVFFVLILATIFSFFYFELGRPPEVASSSYLEIKLEGALVEYSQTNFWASLLTRTRPLAIHDIWMSLRKARVDSRITGVLLRLGLLVCDWAKCSEIRDAILDFRKSGKRAYAFIEEAPEFDREYYIATACDKIILHPLGWLGINGIGGYVPFFKKALDQLGIEVEIEHVEEFKTAYNMFTEKGFTEAHRKMMEAIYGDDFSHYVKTISEARKKSDAEVRSLIDEAFFQGETALKAGLVDDLLFDDQVTAMFDRDGQKSFKVPLADYIRIDPASLGLNGGRKIALIYGVGPIHTGESLFQTMGSETVGRWIRAAREDKSIAAVVFRVDSPGGSAVASDAIWREVFLCKKEKPFVVSMSDMAGSGGYWISMAAHKIVAQPQTLTGSIGVLSGKINLSKLYEILCITADKISYGKRSDIYSTFRGLTKEERELLKKQILWIYDRFLAKAAEGRNLTKDDVDKIGKGRVWTGSQAKQLNLVDELGGLTKAIETAKSLAGIAKEESVRLVIWPKKISFWSSLFGRRESDIKMALPAELEKALDLARLLERDRVWAVMPFWEVR